MKVLPQCSEAIAGRQVRPSARVWLVVGVPILILCFVDWVAGFVRFALNNTLYSHILLIPFISLFLVKMRTGRLAENSANAARLCSTTNLPSVRRALCQSVRGAFTRMKGGLSDGPKGLHTCEGGAVAPSEGPSVAARDGHREDREGLSSALPAELRLAGISFTAAIVLLIAGQWLFRETLGERELLALSTSALLLLFVAAVAVFCGIRALKRNVFPLTFLLFAIPFPLPIEHAIETGLQHVSALVASVMIDYSGIPIYRNGLTFHLPRITLEVAPECSGIRSTLVLLISSLVAAQLFLRHNIHKVLIVLAVVPLGILRNAFRIATLANLSVCISPDMIHSPLHKHGGPLFFLLSIVPLGLMLFLLRRRERVG